MIFVGGKVNEISFQREGWDPIANFLISLWCSFLNSSAKLFQNHLNFFWKASDVFFCVFGFWGYHRLTIIQYSKEKKVVN